MRFWQSLLIFLIVLGSLAGCKEEATQFGGVPRAKTFQTVVSLSPGTSELIAQKTLVAKLVGRTESCNFPETVKAAPVVMKGAKPNYEMILQIHPDAVVFDIDLFTPADIAKISEAGIPVFGLAGDTVSELSTQLYRYGAVFACEGAIMEYVGDIERAIAKARATAPTTKPKVAIILPDERGAHYIAGTQTLVADIVRQSGGEVVGPDDHKFVLANIENLVSWNPQLIICGPKFEFLTKDPRLKTIDAIRGVQAGKTTIAQMNPDVLLRRGSRIDVLINNISSFVNRQGNP